ncbi:MAG TPA: AmpG family muropeptide MFS transporter [Rickettsiales bacterium]|nr:AmpG family muropeptide MFS transporter [Rickettsiales bacterium]
MTRTQKPSNGFRSYFTAPLIAILLLGFSSGLPLALSGATLAAWLTESKVNIHTVGLFAAVATPYTLKFFWAPLIDNWHLPFLSARFGRRRGWLLAVQFLLMCAIALLGFANPGINPTVTALGALLVSFLSASQDIVIDAYRVEILKPEEQGEGAAMIQLGYRIGMIASGAGALYLASYVSWQMTYLMMAALILPGILTTLAIKEPNNITTESSMDTRRSEATTTQGNPDGVGMGMGAARPPYKNIFKHAILDPFTDFMKRDSWWLILIFIIVYKFADAFIGFLTNPFLLSIGFTKIQIANIVKIYGTGATIAGTFIGGSLVARYGAVRILFVAGFLHAVTNLLYAVQAHLGADAPFLMLSTVAENITGGISAAAFVAFLSKLCNRHYTATQYALLSSLAALGRTWLSTSAGYAVQLLGWEWFFMLATLLALPGLLVLWCLRKKVEL